MNLQKWQRQSGYKTTLALPLSSVATSMQVTTAVGFTLGASETFFAAIDSGIASRFEIVEVTAVSGTTWTITRGAALYEGGGSSATDHAAGAEVLIGASWKAFEAIKNAVNSKLDSDGGNATTSFDLQVSGTSVRVREDAGDLKFTDDNQAEVTLSALAAAGGVNDKVGVSNADTTPAYLSSKVNSGDGIAQTILNPAANEQLNLAVDLAANKGLEFDSGQLAVKAGTGVVLDPTGVNVDVGTGANKIVQRDASGNYPAGDGGAITGTSITPTVNSITKSIASSPISGSDSDDYTGLGYTPKYLKIYAEASSAPFSAGNTIGYSEGDCVVGALNICSYFSVANETTNRTPNMLASHCLNIQTLAGGFYVRATITAVSGGYRVSWEWNHSGSAVTVSVRIIEFK